MGDPATVSRLLLSLLLLAPPAWARTLEVGAGRAFTLASAAAAARDGDRVAIGPGVQTGCAVWRANHLVIEGVGDPAAVVVTGSACDGKALFITQGAGITIRNLTLRGARVADHNGAGIRGEGRDLTVAGVRFVDNENGILSGTAGGFILVRDSLFAGNGGCQTACAHAIYAGPLDLLRVENSRFTATREGHHIKSRAARTEVLGCDIADGAEGTASYAIDLPNGGAALLRGNTIQKGPRSGNHAAIAIGAEGPRHPTPEIRIEDNRFHNDGSWETTFVRNLTQTPALLRGNVLTGRVRPLSGPGG